MLSANVALELRVSKNLAIALAPSMYNIMPAAKLNKIMHTYIRYIVASLKRQFLKRILVIPSVVKLKNWTVTLVDKLNKYFLPEPNHKQRNFI